MTESHPHPGWGLLVTLVLLAGIAAWFYWGQNAAGHVGGAISPPKILWLAYALSTFFVLPGFLWRDRRLHPALRQIFGCQFANWMIRGGVELWLMYGIHAWRPPYGIYHGAFTLAMLAYLQRRHRVVLQAATGAVERNARRFLLVSMASSLCELYFAWAFDRAVNYNTATLWFASSDAKFILINRITAVVDFLLYPLLGLTVWCYYRPGVPAIAASQPTAQA